MQVLGIVGPDDEAATLADRLVDGLGDRGTVEQVAAADVDDGARSADEVHRLGAGGWSVSGRERDLETVLQDLAPRTDYAVVRGFPDATVGTIALGQADHAGETVLAAPDASAVETDEAIAALEAREPYETLESLVADVKASPDGTYSGAIATFTGRVREREGPDDEPTEFLEFEKYDGVAESRMADIRADLEAREGVYAVRLHHKTGVVEAGEDIVFVVVLAGHRSEAFETVSDGIDRLKDEVPLFKKEVTADGEFWAHEGRESRIERDRRSL
ncbi:MAG: molybdopterin synthase [Halobacteriales archaeon]